MKIIGMIPARWASSRFEGKILAEIKGKPMIQHVWQQVKKCRLLDEVLIACDDKRIVEAARGFSAKAVMTSPEHASGTDRIAEAVENIPANIIVNIQGDEPLIRPSVIDNLAKALIQDDECPMATVIKPIQDEDELSDPNVVKVVINQNRHAMYFSRAPVPYIRDKKSSKNVVYYKHIGLYAYKKSFLRTFTRLPPSRLEQIERLEQLRALEAGYKIRTVVTNYESVGVDTPEDLQKVEKLLAGV
ncbi:MAG: 3-deoxy-manno-octulosonate cytidylyltransferase [Candidatus Omnitrophota bacterium]|nr:3-deoxy-manno-octulosonate cytidylyltransferase [Candidatus Omnitrophota bacterium]